MFLRLAGLKAHAAFPVTVEVVLALFRIELDPSG